MPPSCSPDWRICGTWVGTVFDAVSVSGSVRRVCVPSRTVSMVGRAERTGGLGGKQSSVAFRSCAGLFRKCLLKRQCLSQAWTAPTHARRHRGPREVCMIILGRLRSWRVTQGGKQHHEEAEEQNPSQVLSSSGRHNCRRIRTQRQAPKCSKQILTSEGKIETTVL